MLIFLLEIKSEYYIFVLCSSLLYIYICCAKEESISLSIWDYYTSRETYLPQCIYTCASKWIYELPYHRPYTYFGYFKCCANLNNKKPPRKCNRNL